MKKKELAALLNSAVEMCSEVLEISEKTASVAKKALFIIGTLRTLFCIPDNPEDAIEEKPTAPTPAPKKVKEKKEETPAEETPAEPIFTKEDVRRILVDLSNSGHRDEVKGLLTKYGADNLSKLDASHYSEIVADAEAIKNA